jgi:uncharacterized membrane protein
MEQIIRHKYWTPNVGNVERAASIIAGSVLLYEGVKKKNLAGAGMAVFGINFLRRGITGFCYTYQALGITTRQPRSDRVSVPYELGVRVDETITINRPRAEVYRFWRDLANLSRFVDHVDSVRATGNGANSHWIVKAPGGKTVEWDAEIISEVENERIAWRSLEGSDIPNAGSVLFSDADGDRGTEVRVELQYNPPFGAVGAVAARLLNQSPAKQIHEDLLRLKAALEAGVFPSTEGQPSGVPRPEETREKNKNADLVANASENSFPASDAPGFTH